MSDGDEEKLGKLNKSLKHATNNTLMKRICTTFNIDKLPSQVDDEMLRGCHHIGYDSLFHLLGWNNSNDHRGAKLAEIIVEVNSKTRSRSQSRSWSRSHSRTRSRWHSQSRDENENTKKNQLPSWLTFANKLSPKEIAYFQQDAGFHDFHGTLLDDDTEFEVKVFAASHEFYKILDENKFNHIKQLIFFCYYTDGDHQQCKSRQQANENRKRDEQ